jgi:hypothetical protein
MRSASRLIADELDAMDVALPHSLRAPNVA